MAKLQLTVVSQEKQLLNTAVDSVTAQTTTGEITLLPFHIPLFTELKTGVLRFQKDEIEEQVVLSAGFLSLSPANEVTVMVDSAVHERSVSLQKAQAAVAAAKETLKSSKDSRELLLAEANLRRALLEIKVAEHASRKRTN